MNIQKWYVLAVIEHDQPSQTSITLHITNLSCYFSHLILTILLMLVTFSSSIYDYRIKMWFNFVCV